ncbi:MAG: RDD family protein [Bacteroidales bacterium]|nr:RDD family protein [Bacteroidales bacterium]
MMENLQRERNFNLSQLAHWSIRLFNLIIDMSVIIGIQVLILYSLRDVITLDYSESFSKIMFAIIAFFYYVIFEYFTGKTIGKFITKTTVLTDGGQKPSLKSIVVRTLCRFIPFEVLSCVNERAHGWHNTLSKTIVLPDSEV